MSATLASMVLGFVREVVYARYFGTSWQLDAFLAATIVPTILFGVVAGALATALVPIFSDYAATHRDDEAWSLAVTIIAVLAGGLSLLAAAGAYFAPLYVPMIARFPANHVGLAISLTRWLMPTIVATSIAGTIGAFLNAYHRFGASALQGILLNICTVGFVVWGAGYGPYSLVFGALAGSFAQVAASLPDFIRLRRRSAPSLRHPGLLQLLRVLGPVAIGSAAGQVAMFFDRFFASALSTGTISAINFAVKIVGFPQQIFVSALATVVFPLLAAQYARQDARAMRRSLSTALRTVIFLTVPSAWALCMLAGPVVQTLFERGAFTGSATVLCSELLPYAAIGLVPVAANVVLTRFLYAAGIVRLPIAFSVMAVVVNVVLSVVLIPYMAARGLLLANAVSQALSSFGLLWVAARSLQKFYFGEIALSFVKVTGCSALMAVGLAIVQITRDPPLPTTLSRATNLFEHLLFGAVIFLGAARTLDSSELQLATNVLRRRPTSDVVPVP